MIKKQEDEIYKTLARYISIKYPEVVFRFDYAAGLYMSFAQSKKHSAINPIKGYPDLFIAKPSKGYSGMFIEIKTEAAQPFKKDGGLKKNEHLEKQNLIMSQLKAAGYYSTFGVGIKKCIQLIDWYLE